MYRGGTFSGFAFTSPQGVSERCRQTASDSKASDDRGPFLLGGPMTMTVAHFGEGDAYAAEAAGRLYPDADLTSVPLVRRRDARCHPRRGRRGRAADRELAGRRDPRDLRPAGTRAAGDRRRGRDPGAPLPGGPPGHQHRRARADPLPPRRAGPVPPVSVFASRHAAGGGTSPPPARRGGWPSRRTSARRRSRRAGRPTDTAWWCS